MGPLIGFLSIPRPAEHPRQVGAFFSAQVEAKTGPGTWRVTLDGRSVVVTTTLELTPGQTLRLKLTSLAAGRWILQTVPAPAESRPAPSEAGALLAAFVSRGLPATAETLAAWTRWLGRAPAIVDREGWAASAEARGFESLSHPTELDSWLNWQASLEAGKREPPPEDTGLWDLWNSRPTRAGDPWLVMPLHWIHEGQQDSGLLQAHWNPQAQAIDRWHLTAAPAGTAFRLEARVRPQRLELDWHFFQEDDRRAWSALLGQFDLSRPDLEVVLRVAEQPDAGPRVPVGIDVQA